MWIDPFDANELVPERSHAVDSSIFELEALRRCYYAPVGVMMKAFEQPIEAMDKPLDAVLHCDYNELIDAELSRRQQKAAPVAYQLRRNAFTDRDTLFADRSDSDDSALIRKLKRTKVSKVDGKTDSLIETEF